MHQLIPITSGARFHSRVVYRALAFLVLCVIVLPPALAQGADAGTDTGVNVEDRPGRDLALPGDSRAPGKIASDASRLILAGRADEAYRMLAAVEIKYSGSLAYDYLLGLAALDSGNYSQAIFALERATTTRPDFSGARIELARAHFESGDNERARMHFLRLKEESPPPGVDEVIDAYIAAIDEQARRYKRKASSWLNIRTGYDSNANGAVDQQSFLGFFLSETNTEQSSAFAAFSAGGLYTQPLGADYLTGGRLSFSHRSNPSASFVDSSSLNGSILLLRPEGRWQWTAGFGGYWNALDRSFNERGLNIDFGAARELGEDWTLNTMTRLTAARFKDVIAVTDVDRLLYGVTLGRVIEADTPWRVRISALGGRDLAKNRQTAHSNVKAGGRVSVAWQLSGGRELGFDTGLLKTRYNGNQDFFGFKRKGDQFSANLFHKWSRIKGGPWSVNVGLRWTKNDSTIALFDYKRLEISVSARKDVQ